MKVIWLKTKEFKVAVHEVINENPRINKMEEDISCIKSDIGTMKSEIGTMKSEIGTMKSEIGTMKSDIRTIKSSLEQLTSEVHRLGLRLENLETKVDIMLEAIMSMTKRFDEVRDVRPRLEVIEVDISMVHYSLKKHLKDPEAHKIQKA